MKELERPSQISDLNPTEHLLRRFGMPMVMPGLFFHNTFVGMFFAEITMHGCQKKVREMRFMDHTICHMNKDSSEQCMNGINI